MSGSEDIFIIQIASDVKCHTKIQINLHFYGSSGICSDDCISALSLNRKAGRKHDLYSTRKTGKPNTTISGVTPNLG